jgi:putative tryptophan/tyrosine transport system substrate-binding protein
MKRREFITLLGGAAAAWPLAARAQQADRVRRICVLMQLVESDPQGPRYATAFVQGLKDSGWVDGRNLQLEYRWAGDSPDRARTYAAELVRLKPDVMLAQGSMPVLALQRETRTIPIVFTQINDPVESGLVESMARPGGNLTGFFPLEFSAAAKWLAMLREIAPGLIRVAVIMRPDSLTNRGMLRALEASVRSLGLGLIAAEAQNAPEIERAVNAFAREANGALIVLPNPTTFRHRELVIRLAAKHRLPAVYPYRYFVTEGGLMSYGTDLVEQYRQAGFYVDRILRGAKPADLPVQGPTKYETVLNLKTAKALGLTVPPGLLVAADEVIE